MAGIKQNPNMGQGLQGTDLDDGAFVPVSLTWVPTSVDAPFFVAKRRYIVSDITARVEVAGTDAGAVTLAIKRAPSGTAIASGTVLHTGTVNLKGTAATNQALTLATLADTLDIPAGTSIGADFTGVLTSAVGCVTVTLMPA